MKVSITTFPETRVATISHIGPPSAEHQTARKLIAWKLEHGLLDQSRYRSYGLHYLTSGPEQAEHRVDFCLSFDGPIVENTFGISAGRIPELRCAMARDTGSRMNNRAARFLFEEWLPTSGEELSGHPAIFHYVNVGPEVTEEEAITDVYLPVR